MVTLTVMPKNDYYDNTFYLKLSLSPEDRVSVQYVVLEWNEVNKRGKLTPKSEPIPSGQKVGKLIEGAKGIFSRNRPWPEGFVDGPAPDDLVTYGNLLACVLLPNKNAVNSNSSTIRQLFLARWNNAHKGIRVCLLYPEVKEERDALLRVPWEYLYLSNDNKTAKHELNYLLGCRFDISIVHCLNPDQQPNPDPIHPSNVENLKVQMQYLSWLGSEESSLSLAQSLLESFNRRRPELDPVIASELKSGTVQAEQIDLVNALITQNLVHVSCHGDPDGIMLKLGDKVFTDEIILHTKAIRDANRIKAVILLSCSSGAGDSVARELHFSGVPVVVGITGALNFGPASRFIAGFYEALANEPSRGLEQAVAKGRINVLNRKGGGWSPEFGYIRLFLNTPHSTLIPEHLLFSPVTDVVLRFCAAIDGVTVEDPKYGQVWQDKMKAWINQSPDAPQRQWLLVTGPAGEGKTTQIKLLLKSLKSAREPCEQLNPDQRQESGEGDGDVSDGDPAASTPPTVGEDSAVPAPPPNGEAPADGQEAASEAANNNSKVCPPKIVFHFCDDNYPETSRALDFVRDSIVPQLHDLYGQNYIDAIPDGRYPRLVHNADFALWDFVITPLQTLIKGDEIGNRIEPPVIVIDGLDLVPEFHDPANSIPGLLFRYRERLEEVARFLVTADYVEPDPLDLDGRQMERPNEVSTNIYELTHFDPDDNDIIVISSPESSSFLFDKMVSRFKAKGFELSSIPRGKEWKDFYTLLDIAMANAVDAAAKDTLHSEGWWRQKLLRFLNIIAITAQPLSAPDIAAIAGLFPDGPEKKRLLSILSPFLKEIQGHFMTLNFDHKRLKNYILNSIRYKYDRENLADTHELLVDAFRPASGQWTDLNWQTLEGSKWPRQSDKQSEVMAHYIQKFLAYHAYHSCYNTSWRMLNIRRKRAQAYLDLICDSGFRKIRFDRARRQAVLQDIWLGLRIVIAEYIHDKSPKKDDLNRTKARIGFDHLLNANRNNSFQRDQLIKLETRLRNEDADWKEMFYFLGFKSDEERAWWND